MGSGFAKKKKEARMMQQQFQQMQEGLKNKSVTGSAGNGLVTLTLNGENEMTGLRIKPECIDPEEAETLQDLIQAAYKDALDKLQAESEMPRGFPSSFGI